MSIKFSTRIKKVKEYYFSKKLAEIRLLNEQGHNILNLGIGNPDLPAHSEVLNVLKEASQQIGSNYYQPYKGIDELRDALGQWYRKVYRVKLNPESEILPLMGSKEGIMHISMAFTNPGDQVLIPNPGYPAYASVAKLLDLNIQYYNLYEQNKWLPDIYELEQLAKKNCKILWLNYPNMPTGAIADKKTFSKIILWAKSKNILVVNDNPYSLILNKQPLSLLHEADDMENILELNSLSKSHNMAGWRVGMVAGSAQNINYILTVKSNFDSGMFKPVQQAAVAALKLPNEWNKNLNLEYTKRRKLVWELLDYFSCSYEKNTAGLFVWAKIPAEFKSGDEFSDFLLQQHSLFFTPGKVFGSNGEKYVRVSLCAPQNILQNKLNQITNRKIKRA